MASNKTFTMKVCAGKNNEQSFCNPSSSAINQAIDDLIPAIYHYVILEADPPVEKCAYIQTLIEREGRFDGLYLIEVRYLFTGFFNHYRMHTQDAAEVKRLFHGFANGIAPNTAGWEDITRRTFPEIGRKRNV